MQYYLERFPFSRALYWTYKGSCGFYCLTFNATTFKTFYCNKVLLLNRETLIPISEPTFYRFAALIAKHYEPQK